MRTGESGRRQERRSAARGFTYVWLLFVLAAAGAALGALAEQLQLVAQREREAELLWRGEQYARALASWRDATPAGQPNAPVSLEALVADTRHDPPRHHLRRLYIDPFTGEVDWRLHRDDDGRIVAVSSRSEAAALRRVSVPTAESADPRRPRVSDWLFEPAAASAQPSAAASAPEETRRRNP